MISDRIMKMTELMGINKLVFFFACLLVWSLPACPFGRYLFACLVVGERRIKFMNLLLLISEIKKCTMESGGYKKRENNQRDILRLIK